MNDALLSSASNEWHTPDWLFQQLHIEFAFDLDAASTDLNAKCPRHYTQADNALEQDWGRDGKSVWLNPPYGRLIDPFVRKAHAETQRHKHLTVTLLIPARVDTRWWHDCCATAEVRFLKGRLKFVKGDLKHAHTRLDPAPFPSAVVVLGAKARPATTVYVEYREPLKRAA